MPESTTPLLTYAGVPLLYPDGDHRLTQWIARWLPQFAFESRWPSVSHTDQRSESAAARVPGRPQSIAGLPTPNWPAPPTPVINTLYWPTGASRWATGYFLTDESHLEEILAESVPQSLICTLKDSTRGEISTEIPLYPLPPIPITVPSSQTSLSGILAPKTLYLLRLTDARYYFQNLDWGGTILEDTVTWSSFISSLQSALGSTLEGADTIHANYLQPDWQEFSRPYENIALMLDAVCESTGRRFVAKTNGDFHLETANASLEARFLTFTAPDTKGQGIWVAGGVVSLSEGSLADEAGVFRLPLLSPQTQFQTEIPETIRVVYPKYDANVPMEDGDVYYVDKAVDSLTIAQNSFKLQAPSEGSLFGASRKVIFSTASADFHGVSGGTPNNSTALDNLANRIATDWVSWRLLQYSATFGPLHPLDSAGHDDYIRWHFGSQTPLQSLETHQRTLRHQDYQSSADPAPIDPGYTFYTELVSLPCNFGTCEQLSQQFAEPVCTDSCVPGTVRVATISTDIAKEEYGEADLLDHDLEPTSETVEVLAAFGDLLSGDRVAIACILGCWVALTNPSTLIHASADEAVAQGGEGTFSILDYAGADTGDDIEAKSHLGEVELGDLVYIGRMDGGYIVIARECTT